MANVGERIPGFLLTAVVHARFREDAESFEKHTRARRSRNLWRLICVQNYA